MSGDGGFGRDSGTPRRRMLPAVTEVVRELARTVSADPAVLFKAARSVVADELARVKQGFESAPLDVLVRRAHRQLEKEGVVAPAAGEPAEPRSVSIPVPPLRPPDKKAAPAAGEGPFQSAGASDLEWEKDLNIQADDAPFRSAILPLPPRSRAQKEILPPEKTAAPAPAPPQPPAPVAQPPRLPLPERVTAPEGLAVERSGAAPVPRASLDDLPLFSESEPPLSPPELAPPPPPPPAFGPAAPEEPAFAVPETHAEAAAEAPSAPFAPPPGPPAEPPEPRFEPRFESPRVAPPARLGPEMPSLARAVGEETEPVEPAMPEFAFKAPEKPAPPAKKSGKAGWLVAVAVVLAVAAGLFWAVRTFLSGGVVKTVEAPAPAPAPKKSAESAPVPVPAPAASAAPSAPGAAAAPRAANAPAAAAPVPKGKAALLLTPDWAGKPIVYVVHFSSHKDRPSAEKEAKRLGAELGKPGRAVEVDLGNKGIWYRVVIGEFKTVEEARAYRADLEAKKTPGLGFVYEMRGR
ncbi:MAG TPA: SPOR domain-containing protein [Thermoanaerobaculia bacterium]|nr:SPOR domain-containing protein [Thermoanaerobaculia bacterium]